MGAEKKPQPTEKINNTRRQFFMCAKKVQNWGPQFTIAKQHMYTKREYDATSFKNALSKGASPKIVKLLDTIQKIDEHDMQTHGKLYKHFIFSDVDEGNYGARLVITALIANGFTNMIPDMRTIKKPTGDPTKRTFVYLSSKPVEVNGKEYTFDGYVQAYDLEGRALKMDEDKNVGLTGIKEYRPAMKKYVTEAFNASSNNYGDHIRFIVLDRKFKEGLDLFDVKYAHLLETMSPSETTQAEGRGTRNCGQKNLEFKSNEGWTLHVYHYLLRLPLKYAMSHGWTQNYEEMLKQFSDADDRTETLTNAFTLLSIKSSVDRALSHALEQQFQKGGGLAFSEDLTKVPDFETAWRAAKAAGVNLTYAAWERTKKAAAEARVKGIALASSTWTRAKSAAKRGWRRFTRKSSPRVSPKEIVVEPVEEDTFENFYKKFALKPVSDAQLASLNVNTPPLSAFQKDIARAFGHAGLPTLPVESQCNRPKPVEGEKEEKRGAAKLNLTQNFLRLYVTPTSSDTPIMRTKGMLLWHSTGAGKTCTAVAIASNFEEGGYMVVYVCPGQLTSEIKKNVWDSKNICHGRNLKEHWGNLQGIDMKYDDAWLGGPMSYKTFTNLVQGLAGKGGGSQVLKDKVRRFDDRHGISVKQRQDDPFHKMLLIIDEAQKLYSKELGPLEQPHMPTVETYLHQSYAKNEADPSYTCARVVLMTATPISKSPFELFQLLNLIRPKSDALPLTDAAFKASTLVVNQLGDPNNAAIMQKLEGYISYLDLSTNRARFAQKRHHYIEVPISGSAEPALPQVDRKVIEANKKEMEKLKLADCKGTKTACAKQVKADPEIMALEAQLKAPKTKKKKAYDKTTDYSQLGALEMCANKYLTDAPKLDFYPSATFQDEIAGFKYRDGPKGMGYYAVWAESPEKVASHVAESIADVRNELSVAAGVPVTVDTNYVKTDFELNRVFTGWVYESKGPKGRGYYLLDFKGEKFVPSNNYRGDFAKWLYNKSKDGLGYYARVAGDRVANKLGYRRKTARADNKTVKAAAAGGRRSLRAR